MSYYDVTEYWKEREQEKQLQAKLAKEFKLNQAIKEANNKEFDKWMNDLIKRNGTTEY